ncbi:unnamed protein product, partial [Vitis vinifera]|uniref:Uncharacterized protein n=1 Tax=Vitis vinifera TaxID=29760 RepID=D7T632_VITVI
MSKKKRKIIFSNKNIKKDYMIAQTQRGEKRAKAKTWRWFRCREDLWSMQHPCIYMYY